MDFEFNLTLDLKQSFFENDDLFWNPFILVSKVNGVFFVNKRPTYFSQFRTGLVQSSSFNSPKMTAVRTGEIRVFSCESVCLGLTLKF